MTSFFDTDLTKQNEKMRGFAEEAKQRIAEQRGREDGIQQKSEKFHDKAHTLRLLPEVKEDLIKAYEDAKYDAKESLGLFVELVEKIEGGDEQGVIDDYQQRQTSLVKQCHGHRYLVLSHDTYFPSSARVIQAFTELNRATKMDLELDALKEPLINGWNLTMYKIGMPREHSDD